MRVFIQKTGEYRDVSHSGSARSLLTLLGMNVNEVLVVKDGTLITEDDVVDDAKEIVLLSVVSGG